MRKTLIELDAMKERLTQPLLSMNMFLFLILSKFFRSKDGFEGPRINNTHRWGSSTSSAMVAGAGVKYPTILDLRF
jgi:hypothetical protein